MRLILKIILILLFVTVVPCFGKTTVRYRYSGRSGSTAKKMTVWDMPPVWYMPMMQKYLADTYGIDYSGSVQSAGPTYYVNPYVNKGFDGRKGYYK